MADNFSNPNITSGGGGSTISAPLGVQTVAASVAVNTSAHAVFTHTQPTVSGSVSTQLLASNSSRVYLEVQNNTNANVMINVNGGTLTGIVPTATNLGFVLISGASWYSPSNACPTAAITCYQTGSLTNAISVVEAQ